MWGTLDTKSGVRLGATCMLALATVATAPVTAEGQQVLTQPDRVITLARGSSALLTEPRDLERISIGDDLIAEAVVLPPRQIMLNAKTVGTTSLLVWREGEAARLYEVQVTADVAGLESQLGELFPVAMMFRQHSDRCLGMIFVCLITHCLFLLLLQIK